MTGDCRQELLPCRKCGSNNIEEWHGQGTQAEMNCGECGESESLQISDLLSYEERYSGQHDFNMPTLSYPAATVALARAELAKEWNTRASIPAPEVTEAAAIDYVKRQHIKRAGWTDERIDEQPRDKVADDHIPDATKMVPDDRCRAEFEREFQRHDMRRDEGGEQYAWVNVRCLWEGWQAAWNARSCARDQDTVSQFCGEAVALRGEMDTLIAERARLRTALAQIADKDTYGVNGRGAFAQIANDALEGI